MTTVAHVWREWPNRDMLRTGFEWHDMQNMFGGGGLKRIRLDSGFDATHDLLTAANMTDEQEKRQEIERILADVMYPPGRYEYDAFREGCKYGSDGEDDATVVVEEEEERDSKTNVRDNTEDDSDEVKEVEHDEEEEDEFDEYDEHDDGGHYEDERYDASAIETKFSQVFRDHTKRNPFGQIAWYVAMSIVREELIGVEPLDWTAESIGARTEWIWSSDNLDVVTRASELILYVLHDDTPVTMQLVRAHFPLETRKNVLKLLQLHLTKIRVQVTTTTQDISDVLDLVVKNVTLTFNKGYGYEVPYRV